MNDDIQLTAEAAEMMESFVQALTEDCGIPLHCALIGAHSTIVAMLVANFGGPTTAAACERAANTVRTMPSYNAVSLAYVKPAGEA